MALRTNGLPFRSSWLGYDDESVQYIGRSKRWHKGMDLHHCQYLKRPLRAGFRIYCILSDNQSVLPLQTIQVWTLTGDKNSR